MVSILKYLRSQGGYITAAMTIGSMIANGVMGAQKQKALNKLFHQTGEEKNLQGTVNDLYARGLPLEDQMRQAGRTDFINPAMDAAKAGGLMPAISEAFSQRPSSPELDAIAQQERQLKNQALNTGARGGLLRQQMFEAGKNAASNRMNVMENARQNALQRAFNIFQPSAPTQASDVARGQQVLGYNQLAQNSLNNLAKLSVERNLAQAGGRTQDVQGAGGGLGDVLGGLGGLFGSGGPGGGIGSLFGLLGGGTPGGSSNGTFSPVPFTALGSGGWGGFGSEMMPTIGAGWSIA